MGISLYSLMLKILITKLSNRRGVFNGIKMNISRIIETGNI